MKYFEITLEEENFIGNNTIKLSTKQLAEFRRHFESFLKENKLCLDCGEKHLTS
jgi:hypothetical protein